MRTASPRAGLASGCAALAIVLQLVALRAVFSADERTVAILGRPIVLHCAVLVRFGKPCPACGATRGFVMALHGQWAAAWRTFPAAPLVVVGLVALAFALAVLAGMQARRFSGAATRWQSWIRSTSVAYGAAAAMVWLAAWLAEITG